MFKRKSQNHAINFEEEAKLLLTEKIYLLNSHQQNALNEWIDKELRKEYIRESDFKIAASFFFVKKHGEGLHFCIDYRLLNGITKKDCYSIS